MNPRKRINTTTRKPYKHGDKPAPCDLPHKKGMVFARYMKDVIKLDGFYQEKWQTPLTVEQNAKKNKAHAIRHKPTKDNPGKMEKNPLTGELWKRGEICPKRGFFFNYEKNYVKNDGYFRTIFCKDFSDYHRRRIQNILTNKPGYCAKMGVDFNLDIDYLIHIFPDNFICPALGIKMEWQHIPNAPTSPSIDRIIPEKGYVKGNVVWISNRANIIKHNATISELKNITNWLDNSIRFGNS